MIHTEFMVPSEKAVLACGKQQAALTKILYNIALSGLHSKRGKSWGYFGAGPPMGREQQMFWNYP